MTVAAPPAEDAKLAQIARRAVAECRPADEPVKRFEAEVLAPLRAWCAARADKVQAAYIPPPKDGVLCIHIVGRSVRWDFDLAEEASDTRFPFRDNGWRTLCGYLPAPAGEGSLEIFFDPSTALVAYADG